jgi:hypothetical protein
MVFSSSFLLSGVLLVVVVRYYCSCGLSSADCLVQVSVVVDGSWLSSVGC